MSNSLVDASLHRAMLVESYARYVVATNPNLISSSTEEDRDFSVDEALEDITDDVNERIKELTKLDKEIGDPARQVQRLVDEISKNRK